VQRQEAEYWRLIRSQLLNDQEKGTVSGAFFLLPMIWKD
jgi:hypothetical protein